MGATSQLKLPSYVNVILTNYMVRRLNNNTEHESHHLHGIEHTQKLNIRYKHKLKSDN